MFFCFFSLSSRIFRLLILFIVRTLVNSAFCYCIFYIAQNGCIYGHKTSIHNDKHKNVNSSNNYKHAGDAGNHEIARRL